MPVLFILHNWGGTRRHDIKKTQLDKIEGGVGIARGDKNNIHEPVPPTRVVFCENLVEFQNRGAGLDQAVAGALVAQQKRAMGPIAEANRDQCGINIVVAEYEIEEYSRAGNNVVGVDGEFEMKFSVVG